MTLLTARRARGDRRAWALPNGRFVYADRTGKFSVQPPNDNWLHSEPTLERAIAWFERRQRAPAIVV